MRQFLITATILGILILPANALAQSEAQVKYRPWGMWGGYKDKEVGLNSWRVTTGVNGMAPEGSAGRIALYRAAELTSLAGFQYFQIVDQKGGQTYLGWGGGPANIRGPAGADLTIIAVNDPDPPQTCLAKRQDACATLNAQDTMDKVRPYLKFPDAE